MDVSVGRRVDAAIRPEHLPRTSTHRALPAGVLAVFGVLWLWPAVGEFTTSLLGRQAGAALWAFWWPSRAAALNYDFLVTDYAVYPLQQNLLTTLSPVAGLLLALGETLRLGTPLAFNALYPIGFVFTGGATWVYLRQIGVPIPLALVCSLLLVSSPAVHHRLVQGRPDLAMLGWIPLGLLAWERMLRGQARSSAVWALPLVFAGAMFTSVQVAVWSLVIWVPKFALDLVASTPRERQGLGQVLPLQFILIVLFSMAYPFQGILETVYGLAPEVTPVLVLADLRPSRGLTLFLLTAAPLIGLSLLAGGWHPERYYWGSLGLALLLLSPSRSPTPSFPFSLVDWFVIASIALALFVAVSLTPLWRRWQHGGRTSLTLGLPAAALLMLSAVALTQASPQVVARNQEAADVYARIGREGGDYAVIGVPMGVSSLDGRSALGDGADLQAYAALHGKRTTNGFVLGPAEPVVERQARSPLFLFLARSVPPSDAAEQELQDVVHGWPVGYVVVHLDRLDLDRRQVILTFLDAQTPTLCRVLTGTSVVVYRTSWHPAGCAVGLP